MFVEIVGFELFEVYFFINTNLYAKCEPNLARIFGVHEHIGNSQATVL
jgi:hypothetical protein